MIAWLLLIPEIIGQYVYCNCLLTLWRVNFEINLIFLIKPFLFKMMKNAFYFILKGLSMKQINFFWKVRARRWSFLQVVYLILSKFSFPSGLNPFFELSTRIANVEITTLHSLFWLGRNLFNANALSTI